MNINYKKFIAGSIIATLMIGTVAGADLTPTTANVDEAKVEKNVISVSGMAKVKVAPNIAYIDLGVRTSAKTASQAQQENAKKMSAVIDAIKKAGIDIKDIKTSNYYVNPTYLYETKQSKLVGYEATNTVTVKVRDITKTGEIIDIASNIGSNVTDNVRFGLVEASSYNQALTDALKNAQGKANALAAVIGKKLNTPSKITEQYFDGRQTLYSNVAMNYKAKAAAQPSTPVESGEIEITATVNVEYQY